jgi:hypothetical protein
VVSFDDKNQPSDPPREAKIPMTNKRTTEDLLAEMTRHRDSLVEECRSLRQQLNDSIRINLCPRAASLLKREADEKDMPPRNLAKVLIETICKDRLFKAVLDA